MILKTMIESIHLFLVYISQEHTLLSVLFLVQRVMPVLCLNKAKHKEFQSWCFEHQSFVKMHFFPANQTQIKNLEVFSVLSAVNSHWNLDNNINDLEKILTSFESICKGMEKREKIRKWTINNTNKICNLSNIHNHLLQHKI